MPSFGPNKYIKAEEYKDPMRQNIYTCTGDWYVRYYGNNTYEFPNF